MPVFPASSVKLGKRGRNRASKAGKAGAVARCLAKLEELVTSDIPLVNG